MTRTTPTRYAAALGLLAALGMAVAGCAGGSSPSGAGSTAAAPTQLRITVTGKQVSPAPRVVDLGVGHTLSLTVTSDHDDELHAHGFDVEKALKAGVPLVVTLTGSQPGLYEVELHHPDLRLLQVAVR